MREPPPNIAVTDIGEYIRHHACERRFRLKFRGGGNSALPFARRLFNPLDPVLQAAGQQREDEWAGALDAAGYVDLRAGLAGLAADENLPWNRLLDGVGRLRPGAPAYARQVRVEADLGAFHVVGNIDFVLVRWADGRPLLRLVECKASRRDHTYQRVQVALYRMLVRAMATGAGAGAGAGAESCPPAWLLADDRIECVVARIDEQSNRIQAIPDLVPLDLALIEEDLAHLLRPGAALDQIVHADVDDLAYQIDMKCDDCVFNVNCLPESARQRRPELLGIEPSAVRALQAAGVATLDDLARLDLDGEAGRRIQATPGFGDNLAQLTARARARITTLPGGKLDPDDYEVEPLPFSRQSQLPEHVMPWGQRLTRVYLEVNFDYVENRVGALAAHVTNSAGRFDTGFRQEEAGWRPDPTPRERLPRDDESAADDGGAREDEPLYGPVAGRDIVELIQEEWPADPAAAAQRERELIERFFQRLTLAMREIAGENEAPIHVYVWTGLEMTRLVEACARSDSNLLGHLHELLGCRESLEQLIFSVVGEEVDRRYALGWTGRGLSVVASLRWFGRQYHWTRWIAGELVQLDRVFEQDIFDFKTRLALRPDGAWGDPDDPGATRRPFEIRSRFNDTLKAPYWRAHWGTLPDPTRVADGQTRAAIARYNRAAAPGYLEAYLAARVHAVRWVEENVRFKNRDIQKAPMQLDRLVEFALGVNDARAAAIDFLKLDQHIKVRGWIGEHLLPPAGRIGRGRTVPLARVMPVEGQPGVLSATLALGGAAAEDLASMCSLGEGDFVRLCEHPDGSPTTDHTLGQLLWGCTCTVERLDWETGEVTLSVVPGKANHYRLSSFAWDNRCAPFATLNESVSDFVGGRVEQRLNTAYGAHINAWLDRLAPRVPEQVSPDDTLRRRLREMLGAIRLAGGYGYEASQIDAVLDGLTARIQALQGPPGTGKTTTTALATLTRILARREPGDVVLIAANTHTAVDTLLASIERLLPEFERRAAAAGLRCPPIALAKAHSSNPPAQVGAIGSLNAERPLTPVQNLMKESVVVIGGTTSAVLKLAANMNKGAKFKDLAEGFQTRTLIVDEASMMVFPHFLALATLVALDGEIMLAGDQRQLAPIVAHDWDHEDRPPVLLYQPHLSAIEMAQELAQLDHVSPRSIRRSALDYTFRLPGVVRDLVSRLYRLDDIELRGQAVEHHAPPAPIDADDWGWIWRQPTGLFLARHAERASRQSNDLEVEIIRRILDAGGQLRDGSVAIVTPHRAQRTLLRREMAGYVGGPVDVVDTVEKLQGNERETVIVSGVASDPAAISATAEFILGLNRSNVAFSRARARLIVVCSEALLNHIAADFDLYQEALLWKSLRAVCAQPAMRCAINGHDVRVFVPALPVPPAPAAG